MIVNPKGLPFDFWIKRKYPFSEFSACFRLETGYRAETDGNRGIRRHKAMGIGSNVSLKIMRGGLVGRFTGIYNRQECQGDREMFQKGFHKVIVFIQLNYTFCITIS